MSITRIERSGGFERRKLYTAISPHDHTRKELKQRLGDYFSYMIQHSNKPLELVIIPVSAVEETQDANPVPDLIDCSYIQALIHFPRNQRKVLLTEILNNALSSQEIIFRERTIDRSAYPQYPQIVRVRKKMSTRIDGTVSSVPSSIVNFIRSFEGEDVEEV